MAKLRKTERNLAPNFRGCFTFFVSWSHGRVCLSGAEQGFNPSQSRKARTALKKPAVGKTLPVSCIDEACVPNKVGFTPTSPWFVFIQKELRRGAGGLDVGDYRRIYQKLLLRWKYCLSLKFKHRTRSSVICTILYRVVFRDHPKLIMIIFKTKMVQTFFRGHCQNDKVLMLTMVILHE